MQVSLPQIIAAIVNFFVLLAILKVFLYKPVFNMLEARKAEIDQNLSEAERAREEAGELKRQYEVELKEANTKAQAIINEATELGEKNRTDLIAEARAEITRLNERAKADIARETEQAAQRLKAEVANIAIDAAESVLKREVSQAEHEQVLDQFIAEEISAGIAK
ncbi:F0F1 ATP synthase subunit B [Peptococcus simiae]|uniref:F0F1 ATP synthase subunit B n=1 Tax=Peptococcus simiae TaxID=1643805 RepID=UPI0039814122